MFWKKRSPELRKRTTEIVFNKQTFNVGKTWIELIFDDGISFFKEVEGVVRQDYSLGYDDFITYDNILSLSYLEPRVSTTKIYKSIDSAKEYLKCLNGEKLNCLNNDNDVRFVKIGKVIAATIKSTEDLNVEFNVASVVKI